MKVDNIIFNSSSQITNQNQLQPSIIQHESLWSPQNEEQMEGGEEDEPECGSPLKHNEPKKEERIINMG